MSTESFLKKLEQSSTLTFVLPTLQEEITYRKMDVIEASINNRLPHFLASRVLESMRKSVSGNPVDNPEIDLENKDIQDLLIKSTEMWEKLVIEPALTPEQISQVPSQDRLAWFLNAVAKSQEAATKGGGVITADEVGNFPDTRTKRNSKRSVSSENV